MTALHYAAERGNEKLVNLLLEYQANEKAVDNWGRTPLHLALPGYNKKEIIDILKSPDVITRIKSKRRRNNVILQRTYIEHTRIISYLLHHFEIFNINLLLTMERDKVNKNNVTT